MKANEAPEKIYMTPCFGAPNNVLLATFSKSHLNFHRDIEYTRTDAFIEKAQLFLIDKLKEIPMGDGKMKIKADCSLEGFIEEFRKNMEGE